MACRYAKKWRFVTPLTTLINYYTDTVETLVTLKNIYTMIYLFLGPTKSNNEMRKTKLG